MLKWINDRIENNLRLQFTIMVIQLPHMLWAYDVAFNESKLLSIFRGTPVDFLLYGIDLVEIVSIVAMALTLIAIYRVKKLKNEKRL